MQLAKARNIALIAAATMAVGVVLVRSWSRPALPPTEAPPAEASTAPRPFGEAPWCEASGLVELSRGRFLVADNEVKTGLLLASLGDDGRLVPVRQMEFTDGWEIDDIESLASTEAGVFVLGSHGRKKWKVRGSKASCPPDGERTRASLVRLANDRARVERQWIWTPQAWDQALQTTARCVTALFPGLDGSGLETQVCEAIVRADTAARRGEQAGCTTAFNIEGAVAISDESGERVWVGLRAPVLAEGAILLRVGDSDGGLSFDAVAVVDLGGRGVRGLDATSKHLAGLAGPVADSDEPFALWRVPLEQLRPSARLTPSEQPVPTSAEGVAAGPTGALLVFDGEEGSRHACAQPSAYLRVTLPGD